MPPSARVLAGVPTSRGVRPKSVSRVRSSAFPLNPRATSLMRSGTNPDVRGRTPMANQVSISKSAMPSASATVGASGNRGGIGCGR